MTGRARTIAGLVLVLLPIAAAAQDVRSAATHWHRLSPVAAGESLPRFALASLQPGDVVTHESIANRVAVVTFWATWCGACQSELSDLQRLSAEPPWDRDAVAFLAVNHEGGGTSPEQARPLVQQFAKTRGLSVPVALDDGGLSRRMRVGPIPHTVIVDRDGVIRHVHQGRVTVSTLVDEVERLL